MQTDDETEQLVAIRKREVLRLIPRLPRSTGATARLWIHMANGRTFQRNTTQSVGYILLGARAAMFGSLFTIYRRRR